jgi:hypothetical protein
MLMWPGGEQGTWQADQETRVHLYYVRGKLCILTICITSYSLIIM